MSSKILNESSISTPPAATIPIKQVINNRKSVPLVVSYTSFESNKETKIPAKLFDVSERVRIFVVGSGYSHLLLASASYD